MEVTLDWEKDMLFRGKDSRGHETMLDAAEAVGGTDSAPTPKEYVLMGLAGCSGMDVAAILRKSRSEPERFRVKVETELTDDTPKVFKSIKVKYIFSPEVDHGKAERAADLSFNKYCGVGNMLRKHSDISYDVIYE